MYYAEFEFSDEYTYNGKSINYRWIYKGLFYWKIFEYICDESMICFVKEVDLTDWDNI